MAKTAYIRVQGHESENDTLRLWQPSVVRSLRCAADLIRVSNPVCQQEEKDAKQRLDQGRVMLGVLSEVDWWKYEDCECQ